MSDLNSLVHAVTTEAYEMADKKGRLPEGIEVKANFDMDHSGRLALDQSRRFPGLINVSMVLAPQAAPPGLRLIADHLANEATSGPKKNTRKRVNHEILYRRQGGYCAGCDLHYQIRMGAAVPFAFGVRST